MGADVAIEAPRTRQIELSRDLHVERPFRQKEASKI
jgi:hypothetical protein